MADFDAQDEVQPDRSLRRQIQDLQMANQQLNQMANQMHIQNQFLMGQQNQRFQNDNFPPQVPPQLAPRPNLNLPQPKEFTGLATELKTFKHKLIQFLRGNHNTYFDAQSQIMYASSLLQGPAQQWLETLIDSRTDNLPDHYTLDSFLGELTAFFGGGVTMASRELSLDNLRHTGTVADLAIAFQIIINNYDPRWTDSAAIYVLSRKLKESIHLELGRKGDVPEELQAYIAAAIHVENYMATGRPRQQQQQQQQQQQLQQPRLQNPSRRWRWAHGDRRYPQQPRPPHFG